VEPVPDGCLHATTSLSRRVGQVASALPAPQDTLAMYPDWQEASIHRDSLAGARQPGRREDPALGLILLAAHRPSGLSFHR